MRLIIYALSFPDQKELRALVSNVEDRCYVTGDIPILQQIEVIKRNLSGRNFPIAHNLF